MSAPPARRRMIGRAWGLLAALTFCPSPATAEPATPPEAPDPLGGFTLDDIWSGWFRRHYDRHGRPDVDGAPQQILHRRRGPEYEMDLAVAGFRLADAVAWRDAQNAARLRMQSLDEFNFAHGIQIKGRWPTSEAGYLGLRFDRRYGWSHDSDLLRIDFGHDAIADGPFFVRLGLYPRGEKEDIDAELVVGARDPSWGEARVRVAAFDPFIDAAYRLAEGRGLKIDRHLDQLDPPLALTLEVLSARVAGLRLEAYGGVVLPQRLRVWHPERAEDDHHRRVEGWMAAALAEYRVIDDALAIGVTARRWSTRFGEVAFDDRTRNWGLDEALSHAEVYALGAPHPAVRVEARLVRMSAEGLVDPLDHERRAVGESRWLSHLRGWWMPSASVGLEIGVIRTDRSISGELAGRLAGSNNRLVTRCVWQIGPRVQATVGTGWDLDPDDGRYDGSGVTIIFTE